MEVRLYDRTVQGTRHKALRRPRTVLRIWYSMYYSTRCTYEIRSTDRLLGATVRSTGIPTTVLQYPVRVLCSYGHTGYEVTGMSNVRLVHRLHLKLYGLESRSRNKRMYPTRVTYACNLVLIWSCSCCQNALIDRCTVQCYCTVIRTAVPDENLHIGPILRCKKSLAKEGPGVTRHIVLYTQQTIVLVSRSP